MVNARSFRFDDAIGFRSIKSKNCKEKRKQKNTSWNSLDTNSQHCDWKWLGRKVAQKTFSSLTVAKWRIYTRWHDSLFHSFCMLYVWRSTNGKHDSWEEDFSPASVDNSSKGGEMAWTPSRSWRKDYMLSHCCCTLPHGRANRKIVVSHCAWFYRST